MAMVGRGGKEGSKVLESERKRAGKDLWTQGGRERFSLSEGGGRKPGEGGRGRKEVRDRVQ